MILPARGLRLGINIEIRQARASDAPVLADFNLRLAAETEALRLDPAVVAGGVAALLADSAKGVYYVAEVDGEVVGQLMITYEWSDWRNGPLWWVQSVYVKAEFRRHGIFRQLFDHVQTMARNRGDVRALRLYVHGDNVRAHQSYERLGMTRTPYEVFELELGKPKAEAMD